MKRKIVLAFFLLLVNLVFSQSGKLIVKGKVIDETKMGIPFAAVSIAHKSIGIATTEDGDFRLLLTNENLEDTLVISTIGYKTFKILVRDYILQKEKIIALEEEVGVLDEVTLTASIFYVRKALKNLKNSTVSQRHQLNLLYRRYSTEDHKTRFFVEHYIKAIDRGPVSNAFVEMEITQSRKSADYRFVKQTQNVHGIKIMNRINVVRKGISVKKYKWKNVGGTTYDGEDIIIIEGSRWKGDALRLYIGMDTYGIYKIENSDLNAIYIYKKNSEGKLFLSYHSREWKSKKNISNQLKTQLKKKNNKVNLSYRHEMFVLDIETDKKKFDIDVPIQANKDIANYKIPFNVTFWNNFVAPPETEFYKKSIKEIESIYGVPIEVQFKVVNK